MAVVTVKMPLRVGVWAASYLGQSLIVVCFVGVR